MNNEFNSRNVLYSERDLDKLNIGSRASRYRWRRDGLFPQPIKISKRRSVYLKSEIEEWMQKCIAVRDGEAS